MRWQCRQEECVLVLNDLDNRARTKGMKGKQIDLEWLSWGTLSLVCTLQVGCSCCSGLDDAARGRATASAGTAQPKPVLA